MVDEEQKAKKVNRAKTVQSAERRRVRDMLERDRRGRDREEARRQAELQVMNGNFANIEDTVVEPTPEWREKGDTATYHPKQPDNTVREVKTVRRLSAPLVRRIFNAGKITRKQYHACLIYRDTFDRTGLAGKAKTARYGIQGQLPGPSRSNPPMPIADWEIDARDSLDSARAAMTGFYLRFFDAVVLDDLPLRQASRYAKCRNGKELLRFRDMAGDLVRHYEDLGIDLLRYETDS